MYSHKLAARADAANTMARELAADVLNIMGHNTKLAGVLTTNCPPFREARGAIANLSNAALRMWELACAARYEEMGVGGVGEVDVERPQPIAETPIMYANLIGTEDAPEVVG